MDLVLKTIATLLIFFSGKDPLPASTSEETSLIPKFLILLFFKKVNNLFASDF